MNACPFCSEEFGFSPGLVEHLLDHHTSVYGMFAPLAVSSDGLFVRCWCGMAPYHTQPASCEVLSEFGRHLQSNGGAEAHWLHHLLGLDANRTTIGGRP